MTPTWNAADLDAEFVFNRTLAHGPDLDILQRLIVQSAPTWAPTFRVWRSDRRELPVDVSQAGTLARAIRASGGERGPTYQSLVQRHGKPALERFIGSAEIRGTSPEIVIVVSFDELVVSQLGSKVRLGNTISVQVRRPTVEGRSARSWMRATFEAWCESLSPAWASAQVPAEYWAKVMSEGTSIRAIGRDFSRHLPGLFWLNFFGPPYRELIDFDRPPSAAGLTTVALRNGLLVQLSDDPQAWDTDAYADAERLARLQLGSELFFSKADPLGRGVVPNWTATDPD